MASTNLDAFMPIIVMMGIAVALYGGGLLVAKLMSPSNPSKVKSMAYECGEEPVGSAWSHFNVRFYVVGLIFIIFDVEAVLMFPVAKILKEMNELGLGFYVLNSFLAFVFILLAALAYCWRKGDLDWVKSFNVTKKK